MMQFGYFYLNGRLTIYDVSLEVRQGRRVYVASLSEDPRVSFASLRAENAVMQLREYLETFKRARRQPMVSWMPQRAQTRV